MAEQEEELEQEEHEEEQEEQGPDVAEVEAKARDMGWVPKEDFRGDPDNWRPADEFVRRGEEFIPFLKKDRDKFRERADELEARVEALQAEHAEKLERLEHMSSVGIKELRSQYERQFASLKRQAVREGDEDAYAAYEAQEKEALSDLDKKAAPPEPEKKDDDKPQLSKSQQETLDGWVADNGWFTTDAEMRAVASAHHEKLMTEKPGLTLAENLEATRDYVKSKYPEKFGVKQGNNRGSPVESGSRGGDGGGKTLWSKLPKDARGIAEAQFEQGLFTKDAAGNPLESISQRRERYAELYFGAEK